MASPDEQFAAEQFEILMNTFEKAGLEQYEISNFARNQQYSKHNTNYWKGINYLGVGPGAHSFNKGSRQFNIANNHKYLQEIKLDKIAFDLEILSPKDKFNEYLLTSIRTQWGLSVNNLRELGEDFFTEIENEITILAKSKHLIWQNDRICLTNQGKFLADEITAKLLVV